MSTLDASIVNISLPTIVRMLNTDIQAVAWVVTGYLVTITGSLLLVGRLADLFGQRRMYLMGLLTFTVGSALCGVSPSIFFLIGSRLVQGLGAASAMVNGMAIVATAFPEKGRGQALGILGSIVSVGFLTGPLIGGFLVEHLGWRSVFFINLPIGAAGIVISLKTLDKDGPMKKVALDFGVRFFFYSASPPCSFFSTGQAGARLLCSRDCSVSSSSLSFCLSLWKPGLPLH